MQYPATLPLSSHIIHKEFGMSQRIQIGRLQISRPLHDVIAREVAPGSGLSPETFWSGLETVITELSPRNKELLQGFPFFEQFFVAWAEFSEHGFHAAPAC